MKYLLIAFLSFPAIGVAATAQALPTSPSLKDMNGKVTLTETPEGVKITTEITGLKPGSVHGYHVHQNGKCEGPDFKSAGDHFNPSGKDHGGPAAMNKHMGDLGNLVADKQGVAKSEVMVNGNNLLPQYVGKAVIIHAKPDDLSSQPSGDSGDRIACGVIKASKI